MIRDLLTVVGLLTCAVHLQAEPPLPPKPAIVERLQALVPNAAVLLGEASVVGEFNETAKQHELHKTGPRGRDFTIKMCWAPDRQRVLFCGANHAVPHRLNDVWEFDLPSLTWLMLYAPDLPRGYVDLGKDTSDVVFRDGILQTNRGGPAIIAHTWWGLTYDPKQKALLFMNTWVTKRKEAVTALGGDPTELYAGPPLWAFYPELKTWKPFKAPEPRPRAIFGGLLEYIPEFGGSVWHANNWQMRSTWVHDVKTDTWRDLKANGSEKAFQAEAAQPEQIGYYDPNRKQLIIHRHYDTHHYDVPSNTRSFLRRRLSNCEGSALCQFMLARPEPPARRVPGAPGTRRAGGPRLQLDISPSFAQNLPHVRTLHSPETVSRTYSGKSDFLSIIHGVLCLSASFRLLLAPSCEGLPLQRPLFYS